MNDKKVTYKNGVASVSKDAIIEATKEHLSGSNHETTAKLHILEACRKTIIKLEAENKNLEFKLYEKEIEVKHFFNDLNYDLNQWKEWGNKLRDGLYESIYREENRHRFDPCKILTEFDDFVKKEQNKEIQIVLTGKPK